MNTSRNSSRSTKKKCLNNKKETHKTVSLTIFRWDQSVTKTWWRMVEAPVNFEKKSERLTLHGVTGFIPPVLPVLRVLHAQHVLQALPVCTHSHGQSR